MALQFYMDVHIRRSITKGLRKKGVDVVTAQEDNSAELSDPELLARATELSRVLFSMDDDLLTEANHRWSGNSRSPIWYYCARHCALPFIVRSTTRSSRVLKSWARKSASF